MRVIIKDEYKSVLPLSYEYDSIKDLATAIKLIIGIPTDEFDLTSDSDCISLINWYLDNYSSTFDRAFTVLPNTRKNNSLNNLEVNFYFKNINSNKSFEKINELRNIDYLIDFEPDICINDLNDIIVVIVDENKCIGLINRNEYNYQKYRFENFKEIII